MIMLKECLSRLIPSQMRQLPSSEAISPSTIQMDKQYNKSEMDGNSITINIQKAFACKKCKAVVLQPVQNQCCTIIVCVNCISPTCYHCNKPCNYKKSPFLQHLYKCITIKCPFGCPTILTLFQFNSHKVDCPESTMQCPLCKATNIKTRIFPEHMGQKHKEECSRLLIEFHKADKKVEQQPKPIERPKIQPFKYSLNAVNPLNSHQLCKFGRMVCGKNINTGSNGNMFSTASSSLFMSSGNKQQTCNLETGSCDQCMLMDRDRLGLPINHLLNLEGKLCCYYPKTRKVACAIQFQYGGVKICSQLFACRSCRMMADLIARGFYKQSIKVQMNLIQ